jgi:CP family cyanate transporter-like MFS transporter
LPDPRERDLGWLAAIVLVSLNLRAVITSVPPLAVDLRADLHLGAVATGALTTVPVACMGLFAPVAAAATRWLRESTVLSAGVALIVVGAGARGFGGVVGLFLATALAGVGIAVVGTLLPGLVRARSPHRVGPVTGIYTAALIGGALIASSLAEPVRAWLGVATQRSLAFWALPAAVALGIWLVVARRLNASRAADPTGPVGRAVVANSHRLPWRDSSAWLGTGFMAVQSLLFYGTLAWLPVSTMDHGMSARNAGLLLGLFTLTQVVTAFVVPALAHRTGDTRAWVAVTLCTTTVSLLLVALIPYAFPGAPWLWGALLGLGMGGHFALALATITQLAPSAAQAPAYSGMAFLFGYGVAAVGPVLLGFLAEASGGYRVPFLTLTGLGVVALALGVAATGRARLARARPAPDADRGIPVAG